MSTSVKISQLPVGDPPAGPELLPVVQGGATVAVSVAQLRAGMAPTVHAHAVADTAGLQAALDGKAAADLANVSNLDFATKASAAGVGGGAGGGAALGNAAPQALGTAAAGSSTAAAREDHVHPSPDPSAIGAAAASHAHAISDTTGLQTALDGKAAVATVLTQGKHTIWVPAAAMTARTTAGASAGTAETTTNKVMRKSLDFDTATQEHAQFAVAMPKSWNEGAVTFQALWTATGGSGGVAWSLQAMAAGDGDALDAAFGTAQTVTDTLISAGALHQTAEGAAVTVAGPPAESDLVVFQIYRAVANAADTLAQDALLLGVRLFYTINAGSDA